MCNNPTVRSRHEQCSAHRVHAHTSAFCPHLVSLSSVSTAFASCSRPSTVSGVSSATSTAISLTARGLASTAEAAREDRKCPRPGSTSHTQAQRGCKRSTAAHMEHMQLDSEMQKWQGACSNHVWLYKHRPHACRRPPHVSCTQLYTGTWSGLRR
jgi:hypothetical protein